MHALLEKRTSFNSVPSQHFEKIFRDAPIALLSLTKNQSFTENVNKFLQEKSKNLLTCKEKILFISLKYLLLTLPLSRP